MRRLQEACFLLFIILLLGKTSKEEIVYLEIKGWFFIFFTYSNRTLNNI